MAFSPAESALKYDRQLFRKGCPCSRLEAWIVPDTDTRTFSTLRRRVLALSDRVASTIVDFSITENSAPRMPMGVPPRIAPSLRAILPCWSRPTRKPKPWPPPFKRALFPS